MPSAPDRRINAKGAFYKVLLPRPGRNGEKTHKVNDEGVWGKLRAKYRLTRPHPHPHHRWDTGDIPQALLAAQRQRKGQKTNG